MITSLFTVCTILYTVTVLHVNCTVLYCTDIVLYYTILYSTVLYCIILYSTVLCSSYYTILHVYSTVSILKVIHVHHDIRRMFITLVWNDQKSFYLCHFHIIILPVLFVYMYVKFPFITSLLNYSIINL